MTNIDELKLIVARDKWAMQDLVYDEATKDWNRLHNKATAKAKIEQIQKGGTLTVGEVLNQARALLAGQKVPVIVNSGTLQGDLQVIVKEHGWVFDELLLGQCEGMCRELFKSANAMYKYLVEKQGSGEAVLQSLKYLVQHQRVRRKTMHMVEE